MNNIFLFWRQLFLFMFFVQVINGQNSINTTIKNGLKEEVKIQTDRSTYCVGEYISFVAYNVTNKNLRELNWSKVLYVELITADGKPVIQSKFEFDSIGSSGQLFISKDILTGNYYLRAYTKWMRNYSPYDFSYKVIKIINPYNNELLQVKQSDTDSGSFDFKKINQNDSIQISSNKSVYKKREKVNLHINILEKTMFLNSFTISVIKKGLEQKNKYVSKTQKYNIDDRIWFIPETQSISLTGSVVNLPDSTPIPFIPLNLTIFNSNNEPYSTLTDENGQFYFALPQIYGNIEVFISVVNKNENIIPSILVSNDFCTKHVELPFIPFKIDSSENLVIKELCINSQISEIYKANTYKLELADTSTDIPFYGTPTNSLFLDDYVQLPTLEDYFNELLPYVSIKKSNKKRYFHILGIYSELNIYDPLVLVDFVAVSNIDWILSISPKKVERIDVVEIPFIRGNSVFGGIINIISKGRDFAGVSLPSSGRFFSYKMLTNNNIKINEPENNKRIPDVRNTLYWKCFDVSNNKTSLNFEFTTGDTPGEYIAIIKGFDVNKNEVTNYCTFEVK
ncbi:MAG: hypothetical protein GXO79_15005 [Chlorobi bacterium]|nr:hypothetical protein [Chlorobiota bacterium]